MKKSEKLQLKKITLRDLDRRELDQVAGGVSTNPKCPITEDLEPSCPIVSCHVKCA